MFQVVLEWNGNSREIFPRHNEGLILSPSEPGCYLEHIPPPQYWLVGFFYTIQIFLLLVLKINPAIVWIKMVLFYKTSGINLGLCYLLSSQSHVIFILQIRDNTFFLHSFVCFLNWDCRKTVCLSHMGQKGTIVVETQWRTKQVFWGLAARCYQLWIINQLRQFTEYITKILDSKAEMGAQGEPIKNPSVSPKRLQFWTTYPVNL